MSVSDTHVLVVYFGDKTYEWRESDALLDFLEHKDELAEQPLLRTARGFFAASLCERGHAEQKARRHPAIRRAREARARRSAAAAPSVPPVRRSGAGVLPRVVWRVSRRARKSGETAVPFSPGT